MMISEQELNRILVEKRIATVAKSIKVVMDVNMTNHAGERKSRDDNNPITDEMVEKLVINSLQKIANALILNKIDVGDYVLLKNHKTNLNIVGTIKRGDSSKLLNFVVITVMVKPNFKAKSGTYVIAI